MTTYLMRFTYTPETWKQLVQNPEDRRDAARAYAEQVAALSPRLRPRSCSVWKRPLRDSPKGRASATESRGNRPLDRSLFRRDPGSTLRT